MHQGIKVAASVLFVPNYYFYLANNGKLPFSAWLLIIIIVMSQDCYAPGFSCIL